MSIIFHRWSTTIKAESEVSHLVERRCPVDRHTSDCRLLSLDPLEEHFSYKRLDTFQSVSLFSSHYVSIRRRPEAVPSIVKQSLIIKTRKDRRELILYMHAEQNLHSSNKTPVLTMDEMLAITGLSEIPCRQRDTAFDGPTL